MAKKAKIKPLLPTLKEKKRYLAFEILSKKQIKAFSSISRAVWSAVTGFVGSKGASEMGLQVFPEKYDNSKQKGLIKTSHKTVDALRASLAFITEIENQPVIVRSLGLSGIMKKAEQKYLKEV